MSGSDDDSEQELGGKKSVRENENTSGDVSSKNASAGATASEDVDEELARMMKELKKGGRKKKSGKEDETTSKKKSSKKEKSSDAAATTTNESSKKTSEEEGIKKVSAALDDDDNNNTNNTNTNTTTTTTQTGNDDINMNSEDDDDDDDGENNVKSTSIVASSGNNSSSSINGKYTYAQLLACVYEELRKSNRGDGGDRKRYTIRPPQVMRVGTSKILWVNFPEICDMIKREPDHVFKFFLAELGTTGSIDGSGRFMIKGKYPPKYIESLLRKYISGYVTCLSCRGVNTKLVRDPVTRMSFNNCASCGASRAVSAIQKGYHATGRGERRAARNAE